VSNFIQRTITGFFFVLILLSAILYSKYSFAFLFFIVTILGVWEFFTLTKKDDVKPYRLLGTIIGGTLFISTFLIVSQTILPKYLILLLITSLLTFFAELFRKQKDPFKNIAFTFLGFIYVALPFSLLNLLVIDLRTGMFYRGEILMGYFFILWANDTGAYLSGRWNLSKKNMGRCYWWSFIFDFSSSYLFPILSLYKFS
jgi:phosphatidate cytidylyltransferase